MKINRNSDEWRVTSDEYPASRAARPACHSSLVTHPSRSGMALVITLIMLSITLVMAVAFLAVARRERGAVTTSTDTATARLAAETALAGAQAQIVANLLATNAAAYNFGLLVSTNFINRNGYDTALGANPVNVNYDYDDVAHNPLTIPEYEQNIANLLFLPRAPVVITNQQAGSNQFRFYLDLNRNGVAEGNGLQPQIDAAGLFIHTDGTADSASPVNVLTNVMVGDPEWIGVLERPDQPHGPNNHFIARYAFFAQPIGNSLDLNYIHNQALTKTLTSANDGFFRNQGVGSWEINLAAFLADLNTNQWNPPTVENPAVNPYIYQQPVAKNTGVAFEDALSLLSYRYGFAYNSLASANNYFANTVNYPFNVDGYSDGPLQTTLDPNPALPTDNLTFRWAGADNPNRYFSLPTDLFDPTKLPATLINRLQTAGASPATYDRYTFYRMLSQLGTDSTADDARLNLNYKNVDASGNIVPGAETNLVPWTPLAFFTNAADRLLRSYTTNWFTRDPSNYLATYYGFHTYYDYTNSQGSVITNDPTGFGLINVPFLGMTNQIPAFGLNGIPVYVHSNFVYSSAVNRVLQLAANIYDASTNSPYPSVFRPLFSKDANGNIFITSYTNLNSSFGPNTVSGAVDIQLSAPFDVATIAGLSGVLTNVADNIYGVPWIIGAKKGLPNFNEFAMENVLGVTRRLQYTRLTNATSIAAATITGTNQMYIMNFSSQLGVELWNSYTNSYPGTVVVGLNEKASVTITNDEHPSGPLYTYQLSTNMVVPIVSWPGTAPWVAGNPYAGSFTNFIFAGPTLTNAVYRSPYAGAAYLPSGFAAPCLVPTNYFNISGPTPVLFEANSPNGFHFPQFGVMVTNRLQVFMLDYNAASGVYHVIDYVHFTGPNGGFNVNSNLAWNDSINGNGGVWDTNYNSGSLPPYGPTAGIWQQFASSKLGTAPAIDEKWSSDPEAVPAGGTAAQQAAFFSAFFKPGNKVTFPVPVTNLQASVEAPYAPTRYVSQYYTWQANDPLVHYLASDIDSTLFANPTTTPQPGVNPSDFSPSNALTSLNIGQLNDRYLPWGGNPHYVAEGQALPFDTNNFNLALRDPLMTASDNWDFPTNKYPTVGWLGRVHRGTPWQTVYLKATDILASNNLATWTTWTGDLNPFDASNSVPVQDAQLFDLFTTALDANATRGTLSVNQANLAAWSAVFSGVVVLTDDTSAGITPGISWQVINPVGMNGSSSALWQLVNGTNGINATRTNTPSVFPLGVFTRTGDILRTPALTEKSPFLNWSNVVQQQSGISDEMYEWLPQQTLGLLRASSAPKYVLYGYGQTLKPAANGLVTSSSALASGLNPFGLVTNYQVTAESAVRAVVTVHPHVVATSTGFVTNYTTTVESYNVLPAD